MSVISLPGSKQSKRGFIVAAAGAIMAAAIAATAGLATSRGGSSVETAPVVDAPAAAGRAQTVGRAAPVLTIYMVGTLEEATVLRGRLDEAEAITASLGLAPFHGELVAVETAADEERLMIAVNHVDMVRAGMGLPSTKVIDLRAR
jgi:hypothetical protein